MTQIGIIVLAIIACGLTGGAASGQQPQQIPPAKSQSPASAWTTPDPFAGQSLDGYKTSPTTQTPPNAQTKTLTAPTAKLDGALDSAVKTFKESPIRPSYNPTYRAPMLEFRQKF